MFKRECVYLLFQATSITRRLFPSPLPPAQPSAPMSHGGPSLDSWPFQGDRHDPHLSFSPRTLRLKLRQYVKGGRKASYSYAAQKQKSLRWRWDSVSIPLGAQTHSFGRRQLCPNSGPLVCWEKTSAWAVIMMEAPGWSSDHHSGEDNEVIVLPLPHKAAIAVSFQKRLWPQRNPSGCLPWPPLCANSQLGVFCLFVCWVEVSL